MWGFVDSKLINFLVWVHVDSDEGGAVAGVGEEGVDVLHEDELDLAGLSGLGDAEADLLEVEVADAGDVGLEGTADGATEDGAEGHGKRHGSLAADVGLDVLNEEVDHAVVGREVVGVTLGEEAL